MSCLTKAEEPSLPNYLPIAGGRIIGFIPFPRGLVLREKQSISSRIWIRVVVFISYDDNHYTTGTSWFIFFVCYIYILLLFFFVMLYLYIIIIFLYVIFIYYYFFCMLYRMGKARYFVNVFIYPFLAQILGSPLTSIMLVWWCHIFTISISRSP